MPNCLAGCISNYICQPLNTPISANQNWDSASPIVKVTFKSSGQEISVGNESAPRVGNKMVVKSFEFGWSSGYSSSVEIHDEEGGSFQEFIDNIVKCHTKTGDTETTYDAEFGWIITSCDGVSFPNLTPIKVNFNVIDMDVSFSDGKARYKIEGRPNGNTVFNAQEDKVYGEDGQREYLTDAIRQLCAIPPAMTVDFLRRNESGQTEPLRWKPPFDPIKGPKCVWSADSHDKLSTITKWVEPFLTENDKGVFICTDTREVNKIIVMEDVIAECGEGKPCQPGNFGTFIVNGGPCSNVIEFNPSFNWSTVASSYATGGATSSAADGAREQQEEEKRCPENEHGDSYGVNAFLSISRYAFDCHGPKGAVKETNKGARADAHAARVVEKHANKQITGELRIVGDPRIQFIDQKEFIGKKCAIVMINPFHIDGSGNGGCGDWLAKPGCNNVLSNKAWRIEKINHYIKDGFYETTIGVELDAPSAHLASGEPLGGSGSQGYTPAHTC